MFALLQQQAHDGPDLVHELFDADPKLHADAKVVDVSAWPGVAIGWAQRADGTFGPYVPPLDDARADRLRGLRFDCFHAIVGGFTSSALGAAHRYGSSNTDQTNLDRAALAAITGGDGWTAKIPCTPADAPESAPTPYTPHTAAQVHSVSSDLHAWIEGCRLRLDGLKAAVAAAATVEAVQAATWS